MPTMEELLGEARAGVPARQVGPTIRLVMAVLCDVALWTPAAAAPLSPDERDGSEPLLTAAAFAWLAAVVMVVVAALLVAFPQDTAYRPEYHLLASTGVAVRDDLADPGEARRTGPTVVPGIARTSSSTE